MRYILSLIALLSIFLTPFWIYLPILVGIVLVTPFPWEVIIMGFMVDVIYGKAVYGGALFDYPVAIGILLLLIFISPIREQLRLHA